MPIFEFLVMISRNKILITKYLVALAGFVVWLLFFDRNDYFTQRRRTEELETLNQKIEYYRQQVALTQKELEDLRNDPATLEKYAREKYFMKRDNEDIYVFGEK